MGTDYVKGRSDRTTKIDGSGRMVLDPLAEVGIRVFMPIGIGSRQFVMDVLGDGKRR